MKSKYYGAPHYANTNLGSHITPQMPGTLWSNKLTPFI